VKNNVRWKIVWVDEFLLRVFKCKQSKSKVPKVRKLKDGLMIVRCFSWFDFASSR